MMILPSRFDRLKSSKRKCRAASKILIRYLHRFTKLRKTIQQSIARTATKFQARLVWECRAVAPHVKATCVLKQVICHSVIHVNVDGERFVITNLIQFNNQRVINLHFLKVFIT